MIIGNGQELIRRDCCFCNSATPLDVKLVHSVHEVERPVEDFIRAYETSQ